MKTWKLLAIAALALGGSCAAMGNPLATQAALDALFSMEAVRPEGVDRRTAPEGFAATDPTEADLIEFLARQRQRGADFNSYRHLGTPLHHAIRSGLQDTALWLLKNGADPRLPIKGGGDNADALGVAIQVGDDSMIRALLRLPTFATMPAKERAQRYWPQAMQSGGRATALMKLGFALPRFDTTPEVAQRLLTHGLCTGQVRLVQRLLKLEPAAQPPADQTPGLVCGSTGDPGGEATAGSIGLGTPLEWLAIEKRLRWTLLPYLIAQPRSDVQLQAILDAGLRQPWADPVATRQVLWSYLDLIAKRPTLLPRLKAVPGPALQTALQNEGLLRLWLREAATWPLAELEWALAQTSPAGLGRWLAHIVFNWDNIPAAGRGARAADDHLARWGLLTRRLAAPLPALESGVFPHRVPVELWPQWFALGVTETDEQWAAWLNGVSMDKLKQAWPAIAKYQATVVKGSLAWLVAPLSVGPIDDPVARQRSYGAGGYWDQAAMEKIRFLHEQGVRVAQPRWLGAAYATAERARELDFAIKQGLVKLPPPALRQQVALAPLACTPVASLALRRALASGQPPVPANAQEALRSIDFDVLQPIAIPGQAECLWLRTQGNWGGRQSINDEDFFQGVQQMRGCADAQFNSALWHEDQAIWLPVGGAPKGELVAIQVRNQGQAHAAFVGLGQDDGTCGSAPGSVAEAVFGKDGSLVFRALQPGHPAFDALALQCSFANIDIGPCLGLVESVVHPGASLGVDSLADQYWATEKQAFLKAVDELDRAALNRAKAAGLFPGWLVAAVERVSAAPDRSVPDKRRRMAWLLAQPPLLANLESKTLSQLATWLPAEDWGAIIQSRRCVNPYSLRSLEEFTQEHKLAALNTRIRRGLALPCP